MGTSSSTGTGIVTTGVTQSSAGYIDYGQMFAVLSDATNAVKTQMAELSGKSDISIVTMFELQMRMNKLSQLSEMSANVVSASSQAITSFARNMK